MIQIYKSDELYHHGIFGQKWGRRHGPPYPLSRQHNAIGAKARRRAAASGSSESSSSNNSGSSEFHKSSSKRRQEEAAQRRAKQDVLNRGSARQVLQYHRQNPISNSELETAIKRIEFENKLIELDRNGRVTALNRLEQIQRYTDIVSKLITDMSGIIGSISKIEKPNKTTSNDQTQQNRQNQGNDGNKSKSSNSGSSQSTNNSSRGSSLGSGNSQSQQSWSSTPTSSAFDAAAWATVDMMNARALQRLLPG